MSNKENKTVFDQLLINNHEELVFCSDKKLGLKAIIGNSRHYSRSINGWYENVEL